ncbi:MAG: tyrosine--tRNA ligase [Mycoplasma sp.]
MDIIQELIARKVINNITNEAKLKEFLKDKTNGLYIGFDPSFHSLHLGNYLMLVTLKRFVNAGYNTIALIGGATGQIGDPSGKKAERVLLDEKTVLNNEQGISKQIKQLVNCQIVNNRAFYQDMNLFSFLRKVGKLINVNYLLEKEIISKRLENGISYAEFSYPLIQGYDFVCLYDQYKVRLQMGGSDQWGNITTGIELVRKNFGDDNNALGITLNLLTKADGTKFGKSESGAIYLDPNLTSPYAMYQFLINQTDADVEKLLLALTFIPVNEISQVMEEHQKTPHLRIAQQLLAKTIVSDIHGIDAANQVIKVSQLFFSNQLDQLDHNTLKVCLSSMPSFMATENSYNILDLLVNLKVCNSKSNARTLVSSKSISVNNVVIDDLNAVITKDQALGNQEKFSYLRKGKKNYYLINWK